MVKDSVVKSKLVGSGTNFEIHYISELQIRSLCSNSFFMMEDSCSEQLVITTYFYDADLVLMSAMMRPMLTVLY